MPKVTLNGKELLVEEGTSLIEAGDRLGIHIPRFCYHPELTVDGNCRMCLVEIEGVDKLLPACATPVTHDMVVRSDTERVIKAVRGVLEFLLVHHPIDCPICDQSGECFLQDYYVDHGLYKSRFPLKRKIHKVKAKDIGGDIMLDAERCVLCTRCIRFLREVVGTDEINIFNRGAHSSIDIYPGEPLHNRYTCNLADICPVGALTSKDFRFQCRVWYLEETKTVCTGCARGCNLFAHHHEGKVYRLRPRVNVEVNGSWMCDIGRVSYKEANEKRLVTPVLKGGGREEEGKAVNWDTALYGTCERIKDVLGTKGPSAIGIIASPFSSNEELYLVRKLADLLRTPNLSLMDGEDGDPYSDDILIMKDKTSNARGAKEIGIAPSSPGLDFEETVQAACKGKIDLLIIFGRSLGSMDDCGARALLEKVPHVINITSNVSTLSDGSTVLLPTPSFVEREGTYTNFSGRVQRFHKGMEPAGNARRGIDIVQEIAAGLGASWKFEDEEAVFQEMAGILPFFEGLSYAILGDRGALGKKEV